MNGKLKKLIPFYVLMLSVILSQVGMSVYITALNWRVIEFSNSAFHIGVIATSMTLPQFLFSLMGGAIADNKDKLRSLRLILVPVSYTHLRAHETPEHLVCRLLLEKKKKKK